MSDSRKPPSPADASNPTDPLAAMDADDTDERTYALLAAEHDEDEGEVIALRPSAGDMTLQSM